MKVWLALTIAIGSFGIARGARVLATRDDAIMASDPYTPSQSSAPFVSLGYREAAADLFFVRLRGYFGDPGYDPENVAALCETIVTLDPKFRRTYEYCGNAMSYAGRSVPQSVYLRATALLERGVHEFPDDWRIPTLAGQIYTQDLQTNDPAQRHAWDERGTMLIESAIRKPGAPAELADWAAVMRTKFGQRELAIRGLREMILVTSETRARKALIARLAKLESQDADEIAGELFEARHSFAKEWLEARPALPPTWYVLLGPRIAPRFDMANLATGGRDLITAEPIEKLERLE